MNTGLIISQIQAGIAAGIIYACMALSIVMIYQAIGHINLAQGEMAMFSTFIGWQFIEWGVPYWGAFVFAILLSFVGGILIERFLFERVRHASGLDQLVFFIGLFSILNSLAGFIWGHSLKTYPSPFVGWPAFGSLGSHQTGLVAVTLSILCLLYLFFRFTRTGLAMRAAALNPLSARLVGIRIGWMVALGWGLASAIGAVAGIFVAPVVFLDPNMMMGVFIYGFTAAVVGGLASPGGALAGGLFVGILENLVGSLLPGAEEIKLAIALAIIIAVLVIRPTGLFGGSSTQRG
jgi:branched-chain amino acid transport system permease protein